VLETGELHTGPASLLCTCQGGEIGEYSLEISRLYRDSAGEHVLLRVTDPALLELTGGIVQGMSGSPILQDGRLVGAVTHVFVNDPTKGYGISIQDMLDAAGLATEEAA
jgi:stage IV sporulation protein B